MLFNIHNGQVRFSSVQTGSQSLFRPKSPKGHISMIKIISPLGVIDHKGGYEADEIGNINVEIPKHIDTMIGLGYPIYDGDHKQYPVPKDDLIYPNLNMDSSYWRKINEAKNLRR